MTTYDPEAYWSRVGLEIGKRGEYRLAAGDDDPFLRYKRAKFLTRFLDSLDLSEQVVLELGCGPGGNLRHIAERQKPKRLIGADISETMCDLARQNLAAYAGLVDLHKIDGRTLPLQDRSVDVSFTVTVLQHVTDEAMFASLVGELCRITRREVVVMEDIGKSRQDGGRGSWIGRTVGVYERAFARHGFALSDVRFLGLAVSRWWYVPIMLVNRIVSGRHHEGETVGSVLKLAMGGPLVLTRYLDDVVPDRVDLAKMVYRRPAPN